MESKKPNMMESLLNGLPLNTVGLHAPAWPGYPDPAKIPKDWMPIQTSPLVDLAFERLLKTIEPVALDNEGKPVVGAFDWAKVKDE